MLRSLFRSARAHSEIWLGLPWVVGITALIGLKASAGFFYESPGQINMALRIAHAAGWGMLPLLALMWLPVMRGVLNLLETVRLGRWLPLERFRTIHRWFGWLALSVALVHGIGWLDYDASLAQALPDVLLGAPDPQIRGLAAWQQRLASKALRINGSGLLLIGIFLLMGASSLAARRKRAYDTFQRRHRLGYVAALLLLLHVQPPFWGWLLLPIPVVLVDLWLLRQHLLQLACPARLQMEAPGVIGLSLTSKIASRPGHYVQLRIPALDRCWHAFSLADTAAPAECWSVKISAAGDWSRRLAQLVAAGQHQLAVDVRGPFASPAAQGILRSDCLLACGGIGVTPFLSLVSGFLKCERTRIVHFVWVVRHPQLLHWIVPLADALTRGRQLTLHWHLYVDGNEVALPELARHDGERIEVRRGRPDWDALLAHIAQQTPRLAAFTCGPRPLMDDVKRSARALGWPVRTEKFG